MLVAQKFFRDSFVGTLSSRAAFVVTTAIVGPDSQSKFMSVVYDFVINSDKLVCQVSQTSIALRKEASRIGLIKEFPEAVVKLDNLSASSLIVVQKFLVGLN